MAIDSRRLIRDAKQARKSHPRRKGPGTTEAVRSVLGTIYQLRKEGYPWAAIANALGRQGVVQGQGTKQIPITRNRLTALVRQIERQLEHKDIKKAKRDTAAKSHGKVRLAPELTRESRNDGGVPLSEQEIRAAEFKKHAHLLKRR